MFSNLLKNCIEAAPHDSQISLRIDIRGETEVFFSFHNNSIVPGSIRSRFFKKFSTKNKQGGTGLGNYSAMLIAKTLGGNIEMKTSEKNGTFVIVSFSQKVIETSIEIN